MTIRAELVMVLKFVKVVIIKVRNISNQGLDHSVIIIVNGSQDWARGRGAKVWTVDGEKTILIRIEW